MDLSQLCRTLLEKYNKEVKCDACELTKDKCICDAVSEFFKENGHLMEKADKDE